MARCGKSRPYRDSIPDHPGRSQRFRTIQAVASAIATTLPQSVTDYPIFSQLPSITGMSSPPEDAACSSDRDSFYVAYEQHQLKQLQIYGHLIRWIDLYLSSNRDGELHQQLKRGRLLRSIHFMKLIKWGRS